MTRKSHLFETLGETVTGEGGAQALRQEGDWQVQRVKSRPVGREGDESEALGDF